MGKSKKKRKGPPTIRNEDILKRMNFLYQAAHIINPVKSSDDIMKNEPLCRFYLNSMKTISKRSVLRIDKVNEKICRHCCILLVPGKTMDIKTKSKPQTHLKMSCKQCGSIIKRINLNQQKKCRVTDTIIKE